MKVYRVRAISPWHVEEGYWDDGRDRSITVFEADGSRNTGLLDHRGNPIFSVNEIGPIGFARS